MQAKVLYLDIETKPVEAYVWGLWKQNIGLNMIKHDWTILSISWMWEHELATYYMDVRHQKDLHDDTDICRTLWELLDEADFVVAQNGVKFDLRKIRARLLIKGFQPPSPFKMIDTLLIAKREFGFTSNKLEYMSETFTDSPKLKHQKFAGFELWKQCILRNEEAWHEMEEYNRQDVVALRKVYLKLRPWDTRHPNLNTDGGHLCPKCSGRTIRQGTVSTASGLLYQKWQCKSCGGWSRSRVSDTDKRTRRELLTSQ